MGIRGFVFLQSIILGFLSLNAKSQNIENQTEKKMMEYYHISVYFYSIGQGTNQDSKDEMIRLINLYQKKNKVIIANERIDRHREGEHTCFFDLNNLPVLERQNLLVELNHRFQNKDKMAIVSASLYYNPNTEELTMGETLYGQNEIREKALLSYILESESTYGVKINQGSRINETAIIEDQDKRYVFTLNQLSEDQRKTLLEKAKELMGIKK